MSDVIYQWQEFPGRWVDMTKADYNAVYESPGNFVVGETIIYPHMTRKLYTDQQKGGGRFVRSDGATQCAGCGGWNLPDCPPCCGTPQPSSTASAQPVDSAVRDYYVAVEEMFGICEPCAKHYKALLDDGGAASTFADALAHPPHADHKEPQEPAIGFDAATEVGATQHGPAPTITDEMVNTVGAALYIYWNDVTKRTQGLYAEKVRAALTKAFTAGGKQ